MTARGYVIAHLRNVKFGPDVQRYMEQIEATFELFGGTWLIHGAASEIVEGDWPGDIVIIEFPTLSAARDWYSSPAYQAILSLRTGHMDSRVALVPGVPAGYRSAHTIAKLLAT
ncbi:hypothetical protein B1813_10540 [Saccharomonospora piscinae]|uniref:DUF1330 domain-containing protein n=1 Tax=Saccharomonospora piscinae TaxID=687388 RepID=A0A1V9A635_SACPI|nr:DUF1330 domain-containing protein [Saccharomonospora piscinae]OQO92602.1 hypothetical protein B1813_10540 [Saccharomonospora piscinae]